MIDLYFKSTLEAETYFLCAWKEAYVKLFPSYSAKNVLSSKTMWYTSLPEHRPYIFCHCSGDCWPSLQQKHTHIHTHKEENGQWMQLKRQFSYVIWFPYRKNRWAQFKEVYVWGSKWWYYLQILTKNYYRNFETNTIYEFERRQIPRK